MESESEEGACAPTMKDGPKQKSVKEKKTKKVLDEPHQEPLF
jgi:hypothetical protein